MGGDGTETLTPMDEAREANKRRVGMAMKARVSSSEWLYSGPGLAVASTLNLSVILDSGPGIT